jgi:Holliday junction resolvase RusA-like endonuclease
MIACGQTTFPFFLDSTAILVNAKYVLPRPKKDFVKKSKNKTLISGASPFPRGKDVDNLNKFATDALKSILYANNTNIVTGQIKKCYATDISEAVGWCELEFLKVVCVTPNHH